MSLQLYTPPAAEPINRTEAKLHARIDGTDEDAMVDALIRAAREYVEAVTGRQLVAATYKLRRNSLPSVIELPRPPLIGVTSVTYADTAGTTQTAASTYYDVDTHRMPPCLRLKYGQSWPTTRGHTDDVIITYVAGYAARVTADAATDVLTITGRTLADADIVRFSNSGGALPTGLSANTDYHVRDWAAATGTFKVAATAGGTAVAITSAGTGTNFLGEVPEALRSALKLLLAHWFEHREASADVALREVPLAVEALCWPYRVWCEAP